MSKIYILITRLKNLKLHEDESISKLHARLCEISNEASSLSEFFFVGQIGAQSFEVISRMVCYQSHAIEEAKDIFTPSWMSLWIHLRLLSYTWRRPNVTRINLKKHCIQCSKSCYNRQFNIGGYWWDQWAISFTY